jgi:hypothetical protein
MVYFFPDAQIMSEINGSEELILIQPMTLQAYSVLKAYPADFRGTITIHVDEMECPYGPVAALDRAGLITQTLG